MTASDDTPTRGLDTAYETMKHVTTLCTGIIGLTVTFASEFKAKDADLYVPVQLQIAWCGFAVSLFFALWALLAITGSLNALDTGQGNNDAMNANVRIPSVISLFAFIVAIGFTVYAGAFIVR